MEADVPVDGETSDMVMVRDADLEVLRALGESLGTVAFQGLRRQTNLHQEKLSRALQRLEVEGMVSHVAKGYALTARGRTFTHQLFADPPKVYTPVLQSILPGGTSPQELASHLEGRWFGDLRWLGCRDEGDEVILRWTVESAGIEVALRLSWGQLVVETDAATGMAMEEAFVAAHRLLQGLLQPFRGPLGRSSEVRLLGYHRRTSAG